MKKILALAIMAALGGVAVLAHAAPGEVNPSDLTQSTTDEVFTASGMIFDEKAGKAIVVYEGCANNGTVCDSPLVWTGVVVTVTMTATTCTVKKGDAAAVTCDNASYFLSNFEADIDDDAKGLKAGCDSAFTAGYGS